MMMNCDQEIIWMCFVCLLEEQHTMLKWKEAVSVFAVSQGSAEPLDRWCWKTNHRLISYFLSNTSAENYLNRIMYDNIITSQTRDVFWDGVYIQNTNGTYIHTSFFMRQMSFPPPAISVKHWSKLKALTWTSGLASSFLRPPLDSWWRMYCSLMLAFSTNQSINMPEKWKWRKWQYNPTENIYRRDYLCYQATLLVLRFCPEQTECFQAAEY